MKWIFPKDEDSDTWWPAQIRVLAVDKQGWIVILMATEDGFELDDGSEWGLSPVAWMPLPAPP